MAEAPNEEPTYSLRARMKADIGYREQRGLRPRKTRIGNRSDKPIFLIAISCPDGALLSLGTVEDQLTIEIPAGDFIRVDNRHYEPNNVNPRSRCRIYILFCAGDNAETAQEFQARFHKRYPNGVQVEEGDALLFHYQLNVTFLHLNCNERGQVTVEDDNGGQIPFASNRLSSGMEFFRNTRVVHLRNRHGQYLIAGEENVELGGCGSLSKWSVEFICNSNSNSNSNSALRLKSCFGQYLAACDQRSLQGFAGHKVLLSPSPLDSSDELVPMMEGTQVKLHTRYGTFLGINEYHSSRVAHVRDLPHCTTIFFDVEVVEREEEGSATERHHETGEGSSVTRSPPGDSGLYRGDYWKLKSLLCDDNSGRKDVLIRGGSGTTAFVRELCADLHDYFGTITWITNPQNIDSELIREEMLSQLILERGAFPESFDGQPWMSSGHDFLLQARCLIVVDNLDDPRTREKFEETLDAVNLCRVIFIARRELGSSHSQIERYGRNFETFELEDRSYVPWSYPYNYFLKKGFPSPSEKFCRLIVRKCEELPAAIVFVLREVKEFGMWKASIRSDILCRELQFIQQVLEDLRRYSHLFCFLYLCIFPENHVFNCESVSLLWSAQGFLHQGITAESVSYQTSAIFKYLLEIGCIHPVERRSNGQLSTFQVVNRSREIMVSLPFLCDLTKTSQGSTHLPERPRYLTLQGRIRGFKDEISPELSLIFGLDVLSNEDETTTSERLLFPSHTKVLDLTGASLQMVQLALKALLEHNDLSLRYLSLSNTSIKEIPDHISDLEHLETLDARHSFVTELPKWVARLGRIRHIMIYHHKSDNLIGFKASCRIKGFRNLEKLCFVEANYTILRDLGNLVHLRHLGITKLAVDHGKVLCTSLQKLKSLESLDLHAINEGEKIVLRLLRNSNLRHLSLHGRLERLPSLLSSLHHLTKIILRWSRLEEHILAGEEDIFSEEGEEEEEDILSKEEEDILAKEEADKDILAILGNLMNLVEMELHQAYLGEQLHFKGGQFPKLKILVLDELEGLESISLEQGALWSLENLTISRCRSLEKLNFMEMEFHELEALESMSLEEGTIEFHQSRRLLLTSQCLLLTLRHLENLTISHCRSLEQLNFRERQFPKLKILLLDELEGLESMSFEQGALPTLRNLTISRCRLLEQLHFMERQFRNLKILLLDELGGLESMSLEQGALPSLENLTISRCHSLERLHFMERQFRNLKILLLDELGGLESMSFERGALVSLENLTISRCCSLEQMPSGIEHVRGIRELTFIGMPPEFYEMVLADPQNNRQLLEHIREIYFTRWADDQWKTDRFDRATGSWQESTESRIPPVSERLYG